MVVRLVLSDPGHPLHFRLQRSAFAKSYAPASRLLCRRDDGDGLRGHSRAADTVGVVPARHEIRARSARRPCRKRSSSDGGVSMTPMTTTIVRVLAQVRVLRIFK